MTCLSKWTAAAESFALSKERCSVTDAVPPTSPLVSVPNGKDRRATAPIAERAAFDFIRYANCWEDAEILLEGLRPPPGSRILSVASAGDNSLALLLSDPEIVVAADINPAQVALVELKRAAMRELEYTDFLEFLGFTPSS